MKNILQHLFEHKSLKREEAKEVLIQITRGEFNEFQITSFLTVFMMRSVTVDELTGFREALLELGILVDLSEYNGVDLCGTGGDGKNTFNISTLASFVVAGSGEMVTKHGNYGVSSFCGSSNVIENLGYEFKSREEDLKRDLDKAGICFLHAPLFNPAMKNIAPIRRNLGVRTFFNMLGPLVNPSKPKHQLVGVFDLELARLYQYLLQQTDSKYTIVHSVDGYDELSLTDKVKLIGNEMEELLEPEDFGHRKLNSTELHGGENVRQATKIFTDILKGKGTEAQKAVVTGNAGLAIHCLNPEINREDAIARAVESLESGKANEVLKKLTN